MWHRYKAAVIEDIGRITTWHIICGNLEKWTQPELSISMFSASDLQQNNHIMLLNLTVIVTKAKTFMLWDHHIDSVMKPNDPAHFFRRSLSRVWGLRSDNTSNQTRTIIIIRAQMSFSMIDERVVCYLRRLDLWTARCDIVQENRWS